MNLKFENFIIAEISGRYPDAYQFSDGSVTVEHVASKKYTGKGFFTEFAAEKPLQLFNEVGERKLNDSIQMVSSDYQIVDCLIYLRDGRMVMIECYTFVGELDNDAKPLWIATAEESDVILSHQAKKKPSPQKPR